MATTGRTILFLVFSLFIQAANADLDQVTLDLIQDLTVNRNGNAKQWLANICDDFGPRKIGSDNLEKAIDHIVEGLKSDGFSNVHTEDVTGLPNWVRGEDTAVITSPRMHNLNILAIGGSPGTVGPLEAEAIVLTTMDALKATNVTGKIVVFNEEWTHYGDVGKYRGSADAVAAAGGVAVLVRSLTGFSIYSPHTGMGAEGATIPAACITVEEALMLQRWQDRGKALKIKLDFKSQFFGYNATSRNVIFEIPGSDLSQEVVIFSGHIDSWDVGQGAMDDGGGFAAAREMMVAVLNKANASNPWTPRRTIRGVFWTAEEVGSYGAQQYFDRHYGKESETIVFASESDMGAFRPYNNASKLNFSGPQNKQDALQAIVDSLTAFGMPLSLFQGGDMIDVSFFADAGVACSTYESDRSDQYYFDFHHSNGDYINIFDDDDIQYVAAIWAAVATKVASDDVWST